MFKFSLNTFFSPLNSQKGYATGYIIMFVIIIIFAVMLSGGSGSLFSGNLASPDYSEDVAPTASPSATWTVTVNGNCTQLKETTAYNGTVDITGDTNGTFELALESTPGNWTTRVTLNYVAPKSQYNISLSNDIGYNTKNWRIQALSGGEVKVTKENPPTGC